ncbi:Endonuclease/exonuclease/phosphatase [Jannaschia sp. CCS1]|nr:Endonuclease/exonuclease/phosphatase [Jannaschia sp. CCS1]
MLSSTFWILGCGVLAATLLPLTNSVRWWVRMWDFPRLHIAVVALILIVLAILTPFAFRLPFLALMGAASVYQAMQIFPYTPWAQSEVVLSSPPDPGHAVTMLAVNVLMENTRHTDLINIIDREDPDVLLLMETDEIWANALHPVLKRYPTLKSHISDDHYGLIFATRLAVDQVELMWPAEDETPAVKAVLRAPNDPVFNFIGLHPRPPVPGNDTQTRDKQIKRAALMTASSDLPTVCMGDFNDVAWSWTTKRFKRYGGFLEPRVGRGMISSFHADYPFMRLPIDQLFLTEDVGLISFSRLEAFGSDHFPMKARVFFKESGAADHGH